MDKIKLPPESIKTGRRIIEEIPEFKILKDLEWNVEFEKWIILVEIYLPEIVSEFIPQRTNLYILIDNNYPFGNIDFFPAKENSITCTFPHQLNNISVEGLKWRKGKICLQTPFYSFGNIVNDDEFYDEYSRLKRYCLRAIEWLKSATNNQLLKKGDDFELPDWNAGNSKNGITIIYKENENSYFQNNNDCQYGVVDLKRWIHNTNAEDSQLFVFATDFKDMHLKSIYKVEWNIFIEKNKLDDLKNYSFWLKLNKIPVIKPWQTPNNWEELKQCLLEQNIDFDFVLKEFFPFTQDDASHILLLGFPIPEIVGGINKTFCWQGLLLPKTLVKKNNNYSNRKKKHQLPDLIVKEILRKKNINWIKSENWTQEQIGSRSNIDSIVKNYNYLLIGMGALGSMIAESMVRSSILNLTIMDSDTLQIGNLCRHTLTMVDIKKNKVAALYNHLNLISPNANIQTIDKNFSLDFKDDNKLLKNSNVIINCSAGTQVIYDLQKYSFESGKYIFSFSLSLGAKRLYAYFSKISNYSPEDYLAKIEKWIEKDTQENADFKFPREGVGCWQLVFPANFEDVCLMSSISMKFITENLSEKNVKTSQFVVFEQILQDNQFIGVNRIEE